MKQSQTVECCVELVSYVTAQPIFVAPSFATPSVHPVNRECSWYPPMCRTIIHGIEKTMPLFHFCLTLKALLMLEPLLIVISCCMPMLCTWPHESPFEESEIRDICKHILAAVLS